MMKNDVSIIPLGEYILVESIQEEALTTQHGIVLPESNKERPWSGKVIAVGTGGVLPDGKPSPIEHIKVGDVVFFAKYSPEEIEQNGKRYLLVKHTSVFAKQG